MRSDFVAAIRSLTGAKTFTAVAVTVLALGIGATTAIYSVVDGVLFRQLPYAEPDRLVALREHRPTEDPRNVYSIAPQNFLDWETEPGVFEALAAVAPSTSVLSTPDGAAEDVRTIRATADLFDVLRIGVAYGRPLRVDEETAGRHRVAVLTDGFWRRRFGSEPSAVGRTFVLDDESFEVVGVLPPDVVFPFGAAAGSDLLVPLVVPAAERRRMPGVSSSYLTVIGRLRPDVSLQHARARMDAVAARLRSQYPEWNGESHVRVVPLAEHVVVAWTSWLRMLLAGAVSVLLIACVNVAVLQMSRASAREHEMSVRASLGSGRWRLVRQLLVENVLLALAGGLFAIVLASWGVDALRASLHDSMPRIEAVAVDVRVLTMLAAVALSSGVACGLAPAWHLSSPRVASGLRAATRLVTGRAGRRLGRGLVVAQVALALVLLVAASLWTGSVLAVSSIDPGFPLERVLTASITPQRGPVSRGASITMGESRTRPPVVDQGPNYLALVDRLRESPGIGHAAFVLPGVPLGGGSYRTSFTVPGRVAAADDDSATVRYVTEEYFQTLGITLLTGRAFVRADRTRARAAVVVNESFATAYFGDVEAVGRIVTFADREHEVVGVVSNVRGRLETPPEPEIAVPLVTAGRFRGRQLVIRTVGEPAVALTSLRAAVAEVFPGVPVRRLRKMEEVVAEETTWRRFDMWLVDLFALLGLVIAAVGIFGTLAYGVERRTREIGVRMALGATTKAVMHLIASETLLAVGVGLVVGAIAARWLLAGFEGQWFGVNAGDPWSFAAAAIVLVLAALLASIVPARRALDVSPAEALRVE